MEHQYHQPQGGRPPQMGANLLYEMLGMLPGGKG